MKHEEFINTKEAAQLFRIEPQTIRRALCVNGHYLGLRPLKLANHRLFWQKGECLRVLGLEK